MFVLNFYRNYFLGYIKGWLIMDNFIGILIILVVVGISLAVATWSFGKLSK